MRSSLPDRRGALVAPILLLAGLLGACAPAAPAPASVAPTTPSASTTPSVSSGAFAELEHRFGARLGVYALDTGTGRTVGYHADDRFAYDSTYKALAAGVLLRTDSDADLDRVLTYRAADLQTYSPITGRHVATGMTVRDLVDAALRYSDNTAANLLLGQLGGPGGLQGALRALGDGATHVDRGEPAVNTAIPGDVRDTSTPRALAADLRRFVLGDALSTARRQQLTAWLLGNTTGGPYIRAGVPAGWQVGDKTGSGDYGSRDDIAVAWPPRGAPVVIAILSDRGRPNAPSADALIADTTEAVLTALR
jgi:beta-lactamase class A